MHFFRASLVVDMQSMTTRNKIVVRKLTGPRVQVVNNTCRGAMSSAYLLEMLHLLSFIVKICKTLHSLFEHQQSVATNTICPQTFFINSTVSGANNIPPLTLRLQASPWGPDPLLLVRSVKIKTLNGKICFSQSRLILMTYRNNCSDWSCPQNNYTKKIIFIVI